MYKYKHFSSIQILKPSYFFKENSHSPAIILLILYQMANTVNLQKVIPVIPIRPMYTPSATHGSYSLKP